MSVMNPYLLFPCSKTNQEKSENFPSAINIGHDEVNPKLKKKSDLKERTNRVK